MLDSFDQVRRTVTSRTERKELLVLACEVDRAAWRRACRPTAHSHPAQLAQQVLGWLEPFAGLLPGRLGRWVRGSGFLLQLGRQLGWLR
jgi:hypothetical protein